MSSKSQASTEFIIFFGILALLFFGVMLFSFDRNNDATDMGNFLKGSEECFRVAAIISGVYISGDGTTAKTKTTYDLEISGKSVNVGERSCNFAASAYPANLTGSLLISNKGGTVKIENV